MKNVTGNWPKLTRKKDFAVSSRNKYYTLPHLLGDLLACCFNLCVDEVICSNLAALVAEAGVPIINNCCRKYSMSPLPGSAALLQLASGEMSRSLGYNLL